MLLGIGVTDTNTALVLNIVYSVVGWVFSALGSRLHDVVGRRKMLIGSTIGMIISLTVVAACSAGYVNYGNHTASTVSIVFIFVFGAVFSGGYTPMQPIYPAEVVSNKMRAKCMGTFKLTAGAAGFLNTFVGPIALSSVRLHPVCFVSSMNTNEGADRLLVLRLLCVLGHVRGDLHVLLLRRDQGPDAGGAGRRVRGQEPAQGERCYQGETETGPGERPG